MASLDTKMTFSLKDLIMLVGFLATMFGGYYTIDGRISDLEKEDKVIISDVSGLQETNKAYTSLPKDVETMQKDIKANAELTKLIYLGLVAEGTIKPPQ